MKNKIKQIINTKQFNIIMLVIIIISIIFIAFLMTLKYNVEGETNIPFELSKISVISSIEGVDNEERQNKWNLNVNQNNDLYLYIKKNDKYKNTEIIENILIDNFKVEKMPQKGELKLYKPDINIESMIFKNSIENEIDKIEYLGDMDSSIKSLKISNQGGLVVFRYSITNIGNYISDDEEQINHDELLKKLNINLEDLKFNLSFDISIKLNSNKTYKSNIKLELPVDDVVNKGIQSKEFTEFNEVVFKRLWS